MYDGIIPAADKMLLKTVNQIPVLRSTLLVFADDPPPQIADQRTAKLPVTFALHTILLLEHNRCCDEIAPGMGYVGDEVSGMENKCFYVML